jgi:hypothetical protein
MYLTTEFEVGVGRENLAGKYLLMVSDEDMESKIGLGMGKSLGPLTMLVKRFIGWEGDTPTEQVVNVEEEVTEEKGDGEQEVVHAEEVMDVEQDVEQKVTHEGQEPMNIDS